MASVESSDAELLAPILSDLLGTEVSLCVLNWNAIAGANLNLLDLLGQAGAELTLSDHG